MGKDVIIALDFPNSEKCLDFLSLFGKEKPYVKIGMELYYKEGNALVQKLGDAGYPIFLDLKLHDIPNTVERAMRSLSSLPVRMVNVHAQGSKAMMEAAKRGLSDAENPPLLIAVTQLTSLSEDVLHDELGIALSVKESVQHLAWLAKEAGLDGVVSSPEEASLIHETLGSDYLTVNPGIRFTEDANDDQKRVATPKKAKALTCDYIVMGRSITRADDPLLAYQRAVCDFKEAAQ